MVRKVTFNNKPDYELDSAVGWNCANKVDDVALIQTLLKLWTTKNPLPHTDFWLTLNPLAIDGDFGPCTMFWLCNYQGNCGSGLSGEACKVSPNTNKLGIMKHKAEEQLLARHGKAWSQLYTYPGLPSYLVNKIKP